MTQLSAHGSAPPLSQWGMPSCTPSTYSKPSEWVRNGHHTYSTYSRGLDMLNVAYHYMDLVPKGRDEGDGGAGVWVRRRDEYQD